MHPLFLRHYLGTYYMYVRTSTGTRDALLLDYIFNPPSLPPAQPPTLSLSLADHPPTLRVGRRTQLRPRGASSTFVFRMELLCRRFHLLYMHATNECIFAQVNRIMAPGVCILNSRRLSCFLWETSMSHRLRSAQLPSARCKTARFPTDQMAY